MVVVWTLAKVDVSTASWFLALIPNGCMRWLATFRTDFGNVSVNKLTGYGEPRFWVDLDALLSHGHHGDRHMGKKTLSS
jgi:hypothetical protein